MKLILDERLYLSDVKFLKLLSSFQLNLVWDRQGKFTLKADRIYQILAPSGPEQYENQM